MFRVGGGLEFLFLFTAKPELLADPLDPVNTNLHPIMRCNVLLQSFRAADLSGSFMGGPNHYLKPGFFLGPGRHGPVPPAVIAAHR